MLLVLLITVGCLLVFQESRKEDVYETYTEFQIADFNAKALSHEDRKSLLEQLLQEDRMEALIDGSGEAEEVKGQNRNIFLCLWQFFLI
jgi:hypothetical protein